VNIQVVDPLVRALLEAVNIPGVNRPRLHHAVIRALFSVVPRRSDELPKEGRGEEPASPDKGDAAA
jgi:hypothetical protein